VVNSDSIGDLLNNAIVLSVGLNLILISTHRLLIGWRTLLIIGQSNFVIGQSEACRKQGDVGCCSVLHILFRLLIGCRMHLIGDQSRSVISSDTTNPNQLTPVHYRWLFTQKTRNQTRHDNRLKQWVSEKYLNGIKLLFELVWKLMSNLLSNKSIQVLYMRYIIIFYYTISR
jgi:hypothetical protein